MKKQILIASLLTLTTALAGGQVQAKQGFGPRHEKPTFEQLDANGDGALTQDELAARGQARFAEADQNGDGVLSADELNARAQERMARRTAKMIERFDTDGDGGLSAEEMPRRHGAINLLEKADTDGNGSISKAEFDTAQAIVEEIRKRQHHRGGPEKHRAGAGQDSE